jgi:hypothetical protein
MSNDADSEQWDRAGASRLEQREDGVSTVEAYEIDGGVVFYDAENPLAWVETNTAVRLSERV